MTSQPWKERLLSASHGCDSKQWFVCISMFPCLVLEINSIVLSSIYSHDTPSPPWLFRCKQFLPLSNRNSTASVKVLTHPSQRRYRLPSCKFCKIFWAHAQPGVSYQINTLLFHHRSNYLFNVIAFYWRGMCNKYIGEYIGVL